MLRSKVYIYIHQIARRYSEIFIRIYQDFRGSSTNASSHLLWYVSCSAATWYNHTQRLLSTGGSSVDLACVVDSLEAAFASSKLISIQGHGGMFSMGALSSTIPTIVLKGLFMRNSQIQSRDSTFAADESNWPVRSDKAIRKVPVIDPNLVSSLRDFLDPVADQWGRYVAAIQT